MGWPFLLTMIFVLVAGVSMLNMRSGPPHPGDL